MGGLMLTDTDFADLTKLVLGLLAGTQRDAWLPSWRGATIWPAWLARPTCRH